MLYDATLGFTLGLLRKIDSKHSPFDGKPLQRSQIFTRHAIHFYMSHNTLTVKQCVV